MKSYVFGFSVLLTMLLARNAISKTMEIGVPAADSAYLSAQVPDSNNAYYVAISRRITHYSNGRSLLGFDVSQVQQLLDSNPGSWLGDVSIEIEFTSTDVPFSDWTSANVEYKFTWADDDRIDDYWSPTTVTWNNSGYSSVYRRWEGRDGYPDVDGCDVGRFEAPIDTVAGTVFHTQPLDALSLRSMIQNDQNGYLTVMFWSDATSYPDMVYETWATPVLNIEVNGVPEPSTLTLLLGMGAFALLLFRRKW